MATFYAEGSSNGGWARDNNLVDLQTETPSTSAYEYQAHLGSNITSMWDWLMVHSSRPEVLDSGFFVTQTLDRQQRPPMWMETRDVAVDGTPLTLEEKGDRWFEHKYGREYNRAEIHVRYKQQEQLFQEHDIAGFYRDAMRYLGFWRPEPTPKEMMEKGDEYHTAIQAKETYERITTKQTPSWDAFISAMEGDKPLVQVAQQYRQVHDCYGLDDFLDCAPSVMWLMCKIGGCIGVLHGGQRALKALHADVQYTKASGIGAITFMNVALLTSTAKWAGNLTLCAAAFCLGDRLCTGAKKVIFPDDVATKRTPWNYASGGSLAFAGAGVIPYWLLGDLRMGLRIAGAGLFVGGFVGYAFGKLVEQLVAANLNRLKYTPQDFRTYTAMMKREKIMLELTLDRLKKAHDWEHVDAV